MIWKLAVPHWGSGLDCEPPNDHAGRVSERPGIAALVRRRTRETCGRLPAASRTKSHRCARGLDQQRQSSADAGATVRHAGRASGSAQEEAAEGTPRATGVGTHGQASLGPHFGARRRRGVGRSMPWPATAGERRDGNVVQCRWTESAERRGHTIASNTSATRSRAIRARRTR